jgi:hypothetical protein
MRAVRAGSRARRCNSSSSRTRAKPAIRDRSPIVLERSRLALARLRRARLAGTTIQFSNSHLRSRGASAPEVSSASPHKREGDGAPRGALFSFHACEARCAYCSFQNKSRSPLSAPSRRLKPRAALLLGPLGFRPVALSQPAPGGRPVRPTSGAPRLPVPCLRGTAAGAASCSANQTPLDSAPR